MPYLTREIKFDAADIEPMVTYGTNPGMGMGISQSIPAMKDIDAAGQISFKKSLDYMGFQPGEQLLERKWTMCSAALAPMAV